MVFLLKKNKLLCACHYFLTVNISDKNFNKRKDPSRQEYNRKKHDTDTLKTNKFERNQLPPPSFVKANEKHSSS